MASLGLASIAHAAPTPAARELELSADQVVLGPPYDWLRASGDVTVQLGRVKLWADRIEVNADGVFAEDGYVALCSCPDPAIRYAFSEARRSPEGEVTLEAPRLEVEGVPVAVLPWLWLRPPKAMGLRTPTVEHRAVDGWFVGNSVYVPVGESLELELFGGAYLDGGGEARVDVASSGSRTSVVVDHLETSRSVVQSYGAADLSDSKTELAWSADLLRGERALARTPSLEQASQPYDHGEVTLSTATSRGRFGIASMGWVAHARRADEPMWTGPRWTAGGVSSLTSDGVAVVSELSGALHPVVATSEREDAARLSWFARASSRVVGSVGPFVPYAHGAGLLRGLPSPQSDTRATARANIGAKLPLVKPLGPDLGHFVTPFVELGAGASQAEPPSAFTRSIAPDHQSPMGIASGGVRTSVSRYGGPGVSMALSGALLAEERVSEAALVGAMAADSDLAGTSLEAIVVSEPANDPETELGATFVSRSRLGETDGMSVGAAVAARAGRTVRAARLMLDPDLLPGEERSILDRRGVTGALEVRVPWHRNLTSIGRLSGGLSDPEVVGWLTQLAYHDRCDCFGASATVQERLGRQGVDVFINLDLAP